MDALSLVPVFYLSAKNIYCHQCCVSSYDNLISACMGKAVNAQQMLHVHSQTNNYCIVALMSKQVPLQHRTFL